MSETAVAPAPAAASTPAPASAPAAAPSSAPVASPAPAAAPAATPSFGGNSGVTSHVDPGKFSNTNDYAKAILAEQMGTAVEDAPVTEEPAVAAEPIAEAVVEVPAPDAVKEETSENQDQLEEPDFELEPAGIVTPEALTQMVTDNPEFGKLLEGDARLKGQLYKTAREAAELKPYREIFPDLESAKSAVASATTFNNVRETFMGSTTREGTLKTLAHLAELSYERDDEGNVLMQDGQPVIGEDFHGFLDHAFAIEMEDRKAKLQERTNDHSVYFAGGKTQEEANAAFTADLQRLAVMDEMLGQVIEAPETQDMTPAQRRRQEEQDSRDREWQQKQHGEKVGERQKYEATLQTDASTRLTDGIGKIMASVEKQGGIINPYLKNILPQSIGAKVVRKILANPSLVSQMNALQRLPMSDDARTRRLAAIDRAYQTYLPEVAREELREAGIQLAGGQAAKLAKIDAQAANTQQTEPRGSRTAAGQRTTGPMSAEAAYEFAQKDWEKKNPGRRFDRVAQASILDMVYRLQLPQ